MAKWNKVNLIIYFISYCKSVHIKNQTDSKKDKTENNQTTTANSYRKQSDHHSQQLQKTIRPPQPTVTENNQTTTANSYRKQSDHHSQQLQKTIRPPQPTVTENNQTTTANSYLTVKCIYFRKTMQYFIVFYIMILYYTCVINCFYSCVSTPVYITLIF